MQRYRIRWTQLALADLESVHTYVAEENSSAAKALVGRIQKAVEQLKALPKLGHVVPERRAHGYREILVAPYRLVYALAEREVHILRIWHSRRDLTNL